jgi:hypothetical protein
VVHVLEVVVVAALVGGAGFVWRYARARKRPGVPMSWQTSQSVAADLHRRVHRSVERTRRTVREVRKRGVPTSGFEGLCDQLSTAARAMDDQLVLASRLPFKVRHKALLKLRYRIMELERTGERIERAALDAGSPLVGSVDDALRGIHERLDSLAQAKDELRELGGEV